MATRLGRATCTHLVPICGPKCGPVLGKPLAGAKPTLGEQMDELLDKILGISAYNVLDAKPELSGWMANRLLKSTELKRFFARHGSLVGGYSDEEHPVLTTNNVVLSLWEEYSNCSVFLREAYSKGLEPLDPGTLGSLDESMRKQRVWMGVVALDDSYLRNVWQAWVHAYYFHHMWYVHKYAGIGGLTQEAIEDAHKEVNKDVAVFSGAGTRVAKADIEVVRV